MNELHSLQFIVRAYTCDWFIFLKRDWSECSVLSLMIGLAKHLFIGQLTQFSILFTSEACPISSSRVTPSKSLV